MLKGKPAVKKPESKSSKKAAKASDALTKKALATVEANIARIEAEERGGKSAKGESDTTALAEFFPREKKPRASKSAARAEGAAKTKAALTAGKKPKAEKPTKVKRMSGLDAAAKVLAESKEPLAAQDIVKAMSDKGYWKSPGGKTPHATIYAAMVREITEKGKESRFKKVDRGMFAANSGGK